VLSFERCIPEAEALDLREGVLDKFLYANADRLFFSGRTQAPSPDGANAATSAVARARVAG
jgi:hypothetical protein